ncbi:hypothetical protein GF319_11675 [Candidatus Bathyarchaeota archaeon]|nr:hypothetical protein [Candidatus Bathyarchaeota archaeon]
MFYEEVQARSLLSKRIVADAWFHSNYSMNVYRGCQFSCAYCDGMAEHYHVDNFREHVRVKINAPNVLEKELERILPGRNKSLLDYTELKPEYKRPIIGISGGVSDSYQQAEKKYQITRKILEVLLRHKLPVFLLTKSDLVLRDIDLLEDINKQSFASVCFTITLMDENQKKIYEPHSSSTEDRFNALKTLRSKGIRGGVMAMPIIPFIGDSIENMMGIVNESKKANSEFVLFAGMTLKPGRQKRHFLETLSRNNPEKLSRIKELYSNENRYGSPYWDKMPVNVMALGHKLCLDEGINPRSVRHSCPGAYVPNHEVLQVLLDIKYWMSSFLGKSKREWSKFHEGASLIERGLPNLKTALEMGKLQEQIHPALLNEVKEILKTGSCETYQRIQAEVNEAARIEYDRLN